MENKKNIKLVLGNTQRSLLPNTITIIGVCIGLCSIKFALDSRFDLAIIAITFAAIFDSLDGRIARLIRGTSKVGKELDSLTDVISFGVAPGLILYFWTLNQLGKIGWMLVLIYTVCCALRLARFNISSSEITEAWKINFFEGVPSPAGAGIVLLPVIISLSNFFTLPNQTLVSAGLIFVVSVLMVSKLPTYSLKKIVIPRSVTVFLLLGISIFFGFLIAFTFETLLFAGAVYLLSIPVSCFHYLNTKAKNKDIRDSQEEDQSSDVL
tara:strand:+ start:183 stop:983 length:801 start_codon:yes stop_codon:yes gene_type:complete